jgi:ABC-2 type transport system ATP-binding protein
MDEICDRVGIIHDGRLMFTGTPAALKAQTAQEYLERAFLKVIEHSKRVYES